MLYSWLTPKFGNTAKQATQLYRTYTLSEILGITLLKAIKKPEVYYDTKKSYSLAEESPKLSYVAEMKNMVFLSVTTLL